MNILLATDGSECSEEAAGFLTRFSFSPKDKIEVVHVVSDIPYEDDYRAQIRRAIKKVAPKILSASADILRTVRANITLREEEGYPDETIIDIAAASGSDLIVMGARGVKGVKLLFLGSSTRAVAIKSPTPVLVVKQSFAKKTGAMKVLFAADGSDPANSAARVLSIMPFRNDTEAVLMHVSPPSLPELPEKYLMQINESLPAGGPEIDPKQLNGAERIVEQARSCLGGKFKNMHVVIRTGDPSAEILHMEKILAPDIIAVGCRGLRGVRGMMGSVSRRILGHSAASVLIGKAGSKTA